MTSRMSFQKLQTSLVIGMGCLTEKLCRIRGKLLLYFMYNYDYWIIIYSDIGCGSRERREKFQLHQYCLIYLQHQKHSCQMFSELTISVQYRSLVF